MSRAVLAAILCGAIGWTLGAVWSRLAIDGWHSLVDRHAAALEACELALIRADEDMRRAAEICGIWRDTADWYERSWLRCAFGQPRR
jgi:hypothetical protein